MRKYFLTLIEKKKAQKNQTAVWGGPQALVEKVIRPDGTVPIKLIQDGWGSSGYYPQEVLERDGPTAFPAGTFMFWNHDTPDQAMERPEGDLNNLAAVLTTDPIFMENGPDGPGLYADAQVFTNYAQAVDDLGAHIGVSIYANGTAVDGEAEGKEGPIIQAITPREDSPRNSVDFVTLPGAGGSIVQLFEAAGRGQPEAAGLKEARNLGEFVESRIHLHLTQVADDLYGDGRVNKTERLALSHSIGAGLEAFRSTLLEAAPGLFQRDLYSEGPPSEDLVPDEGQPGEAQLADSGPDVGTQTPRKEGDQMSKELEEKLKASQILLAQTQADLVLGERLKKSDLPDIIQERLKAGLLKVEAIPMTEEGVLDKVTYETAVSQAIEAAQKEVAVIAGSDGTIEGEGSDPAGDDGDDLPTLAQSASDITESLQALGYPMAPAS